MPFMRQFPSADRGCANGASRRRRSLGLLLAGSLLATSLATTGCATPLSNRQVARLSVSALAVVGMVALLSLAGWCTYRDSRCAPTN